MTDKKEWKLPVGPDWACSHTANLETILANAEKSFDGGLARFSRVRDRLFGLVRMLIPVVSLLLALFLRGNIFGVETAPLSTGTWWTLSLLLLALMSCLVVLAWNLRSISIQTAGYEPRYISDDYMLYDTETYSLNDSERRVMMLRTMIETYQLSIDINEPKITSCFQLMNFAVAWLIGSLTLAGVSLVCLAG